MLLRFQAFQLQRGLYLEEAKARGISSHGALEGLFLLRRPVLPDGAQVLLVVPGRDGGVGTAIDGGCQHHQAHHAAHHARDHHGGDGVPQADGPGPGLGLAAAAAAVARLAVRAVLGPGPLLRAGPLMAAGRRQRDCPQSTGPKELVGNLQEVLPLPNAWC